MRAAESQFGRRVVPYRAEPWMRRGACRDADPELFYPVWDGSGRNEETREAKKYCQSCWVRRECLIFAFATRDRFAILGGLTPTERTRLRNLVKEERARDGAARV